MAKREIITLIDDVTGEEGGDIKEIKYVVNGVMYACDMSETTRKQFDEALEPFVTKSRRSGTVRLGAAHTQVATAPRKPAIDREQNQAIREWAIKQGFKISERGRIPANILEKYHDEA